MMQNLYKGTRSWTQSTLSMIKTDSKILCLKRYKIDIKKGLAMAHQATMSRDSDTQCGCLVFTSFAVNYFATHYTQVSSNTYITSLPTISERGECGSYVSTRHFAESRVLFWRKFCICIGIKGFFSKFPELRLKFSPNLRNYGPPL